MNLISCDRCGVVVDKDKLYFPPIYDEDGNHIKENGVWRNKEFVAVVACPVCDEDISEDQ